MPSLNRSNGLFFRHFGTGANKVKFYLGHAPREANKREAGLERIWQRVRQDHGGVWTGELLEVARGVAKGDYEAGWRLVERERAELDEEDRRFRETVQGIADRTARLCDETLAKIDERAGVQSGVSVAAVLADYSDRQRQVIANTGDRGQNAITKLTRAKTLTRLFGDVVLASADDLRTVAERLAHPALKSAHGKVMAPTTRRDLFKTLKEALADQRGVDLPRGWHKVAVKLPKETTIDGLAQWAVPEPAALLQNANVVYRAAILLGINCGWQEADWRDVRDGHLYLDRPLPPIIAKRAGAKAGDTWIMMPRTKNGVPGLHKLWPETVRAVRELLDRRDQIVLRTGTATTELFIKENGNPMSCRTRGNNPGREFANGWVDLLDKAGTNQRLPLKYLRKASQHYLREFATDDVVAMHARREKASGDTMMENYANRPWKRVAEATDELRRRLAEIFGLKSAGAA